MFQWWTFVCDLVPFKMCSFVLGVGILQGLSSNGWAVLGSAQLSQRIHLMSQYWIHLLRLSICFCHTDTSVQFWAWLFSFLTSSQKTVILLNTISSHLNQLCRLVLVLISVVWYNCACVQLRKEKSGVTAEIRIIYREIWVSFCLPVWCTNELRLPLIISCMK